jgi:hypothetical protein
MIPAMVGEDVGFWALSLSALRLCTLLLLAGCTSFHQTSAPFSGLTMSKDNCAEAHLPIAKLS